MLIPRRSAGSAAPLTPAQSRLWFLDQAGGGDTTYLLWFSRRYRGPLDPTAWGRAFHAVVARHEALRSAFEVTAGGPVQVVVDPPLDHALETVDLTGRPEPERVARSLAAEFVRQPLPLTRAPLHRALLLRLAPEDHVFVWCWHHIIFDAESEQVVMDELLALYRGEDVGEPPVQFPDYAAALAGRELSTGGVAYWREQLRDAPAVQSLPSDRARPAAAGMRAARWSRDLTPELSSAVLAVARRERCTPFMVFMSAMMAVLARHSGEPDVVVGTPLSDRDAPGLERSVGFYVNSLPVRVDVRGDLSVRALLREVRAAQLDALDHCTIPLEEIVRAAGAPRDPGRNPLFQTMLVIGSAAPPVAGTDLTDEDWPLDATSAKMDLTLVVTLAERITLACDYAADLFPAAQIERFGDHVVAVLDALVRDPEQRVSAVPLLDAAERAALVGTAAPSGPAPASVVEQFAAVVAAQPDAPALVTPEGTLTYGELDRRARAVAERAAGASLVGIVLPTGADAVGAVLGALTAGAAYLPLSPADPPNRTAALLQAAGADHVITDGAPPVLPEPGAARPAGLAYVIFTSGSTGRPKGVLVGHDTLARFTAAFREVHGFGPGQRILMLPPLTFDASVGDLFPALTSGAALVLHPEPARLDAAELVAFCARHGVTAVDAPASLWRSWTDDLAAGTVRVPPDWPVTTMMVGGERVPTAAVRAWAAATHHRVTLFNHYGPTEATVCATVHRTVDGDDTDGTHLPIGRPLPHVRTYVMDPAGGLAVPGAPGELYLGGDCLALGYLGEPAETEVAFPPDPFHEGRMYKTGDLVRRRSDGALEFLGRVDRQVKIRGHRIEPAEVESTVTAHPAVRDAAVTAVDGRLVAYAATAATAAVTATELRHFVRDRLPRHLVPDQFLLVDRIPRTAHGKVDLAALPPATIETVAAAAPEGPVETALAAIWSSLLDVPDVGRTDNFFALGGSSLLATRVLAAIERELGRTIPLAVLLDADDLADLARALTTAPAPAPDLLAERLPADVVPTARRSSPMQRVLVTGATGFLGAHLVGELLTTTDVIVECLARADTAEQARERVRQTLRNYGLAADPRRIVGLAGDLARPRFGLSERAWQELAERCDLICHNGGLISFVEPYERLRSPNVDGTIEALRLAALGGAPLHAVSTLGVYLGATQRGKLVTELDPPGEPDELPGGYEQSKWVADRLCRDARAAGMAVSLHRPARISGHSITGRGNPDDYFNRMLTSFVQTGYVPDLPWTEDLAPVDHVAAGIVRLLGEPAGRDFHYFNPATMSYPELAGALVDRGYAVRLVPWAVWRAEVNGRLVSGAPLAIAPFVSTLPEQQPTWPRPYFDCTATEQAVGPCPPADRELVGRQLDFLASTGRIPRGGTG